METRNSPRSTEAFPRKIAGTPLHTAVMQKNHTMIESLIQSGVSLTAQNDDGKTAFELACDLGYYDCAELFDSLLKDYVDNSNVKYGRLFLYAIRNSNVELARALYQAGASTTARMRERNLTALHLAAQRFDTKSVDFLLSIGASLVEVDQYGSTPIQHACGKKSWDCAARMIESVTPEKISADTSDKMRLGKALLNAIAETHLNTVKLLLERGAPCNQSEPFWGNEAIFHCICAHTKENTQTTREILMLLLAHGANPNIRDQNGRTSYDRALGFRDRSMANLLRDYDTGVSAETIKGFVTEIDQEFVKLQSPDNDTIHTIAHFFVYQLMVHDLFAADIRKLSAERNLLNLDRAKHAAEIDVLDRKIQTLQCLQGDLDHAAEPDESFQGTTEGFHIADHLKRLQLIQHYHIRVRAYLIDLKEKITDGHWQVKSFMESFSNKWHDGMPKHMQKIQQSLNQLTNHSPMLETFAIFASVDKILREINQDRCRHADTSAFYSQEKANIAALHFLPPVNVAAMDHRSNL